MRQCGTLMSQLENTIYSPASQHCMNITSPTHTIPHRVIAACLRSYRGPRVPTISGSFSIINQATTQPTLLQFFLSLTTENRMKMHVILATLNIADMFYKIFSDSKNILWVWKQTNMNFITAVDNMGKHFPACHETWKLS